MKSAIRILHDYDSMQCNRKKTEPTKPNRAKSARKTAISNLSFQIIATFFPKLSAEKHQNR
ncbi:MAG: hypothetical protein K2N69_04385 [Helicobacter sp.]|nr:hypothetical protein [Helicobacter sp.]